MNRRTFLATSLAGVATVSAGCSDLLSDGENEGENDAENYEFSWPASSNEPRTAADVAEIWYDPARDQEVYLWG